MSRFAALLMGLLVFCLSACSNPSSSSDALSFNSSIRMLMIRHPVADYSAWRTAYLAHDSMRSANGLVSRNFGRGLDDTSMVIVYNLVTNLDQARAFATSPMLKEIMVNAGVTDTSIFIFGDVIRRDTSELAIQDRVLITYHVRDFDTWLSAFDQQGTEVRAAHGLIDRGIMRNLDDPKAVYVAMALSDLPKARIWLSSDAYLAFMQTAGVEGSPEIFFYKREKYK